MFQKGALRLSGEGGPARREWVTEPEAASSLSCAPSISTQAAELISNSKTQEQAKGSSAGKWINQPGISLLRTSDHSAT